MTTFVVTETTHGKYPEDCLDGTVVHGVFSSFEKAKTCLDSLFGEVALLDEFISSAFKVDKSGFITYYSIEEFEVDKEPKNG
jgi:hypothetical protein